MHKLLQDLRFALRRTVARPAFTAVAVLSLAIGIGANTAIFSLVNAIILRPSGLAQPEQLVDIYRSIAGFSHATFSYPDLDDLRRETQTVFAEVAGSRLSFFQADVEGGVEMIPGELVSGNYFTMLGVPAEIGRVLLPDDDVSPRSHPVVVISYRYWQDRYDGRESVVGEQIRLSGSLYTIVGVVPRGYEGNMRGLSPAVYASSMMVSMLQPSNEDELTSRNNQSVFVKARLLEGVTRVEAQEVCDRIAETFVARYPDAWQADDAITVVATNDVILNPMLDRVVTSAAVLMMVVVALVLLISCANLASFLLAQAVDRRKEVAVRLAMGASRGVVVRQFLTEAVVLALIGGAGGLLLARTLLDLLLTADLPLPFPVTLDLGLDPSVLGFSFLVTLAAGVLFGLAPALQATRAEVAPTLKDESTGGGRPKRLNLRSGLVIAQVAISLMLLVGAGLFLRSLQARVDIDPGFGDSPAALVTLQTVPDRYTEEEARLFFEALKREITALPGVEAIGMVSDMPLTTTTNMMIGLNVDGVAPPPDRDFHMIDITHVDTGFFEATGVDLLEGRVFLESDRSDTQQVVIVSETFARQFWPQGSALGNLVRGLDGDYTVVGVAEDVKVRALGEAPRPFLYRPYAQEFQSMMTVVARTDRDSAGRVADMVSLARARDPDILVFESKTMQRHLAVMLLPHRLSALVVATFGGVALLLAAIGLYGVVSYSVSTRSREVGIRMALGAEPGSVVRMLLGGGLKLAGIGALVGVVLALVSGRLLGGLIYGVAPNDPVSFAAVGLVLLVVALLAAWLPARRAIAVKPVNTLRSS